ncbi:MAG: hypothetical protein HY659_09690 [Rhizobiales bacterium]|nr:hypothetical protein [Hyphomicrobiales bacterium]
MTLPFAHHFDACLPGVAAPVRIASLHDAQVFTRRWVIRDKDRALKALLRKIERANSTAGTDAAIDEFRQALKSRGLLSAQSKVTPA